jgi:hypothetical protein
MERPRHCYAATLEEDQGLLIFQRLLSLGEFIFLARRISFFSVSYYSSKILLATTNNDLNQPISR